MKDSSENMKTTKSYLAAPEMGADSPSRQMRSMSIAMPGVRAQPCTCKATNIRQRTNSLPNPDYLLSYSGCRDPRTCCVSVRSFTTTRKGVINAGDIVRKTSINSLMSTGSAFPSEERKSKFTLTSLNLAESKDASDRDRERTSSITSTDSSSSSGSQRLTTLSTLSSKPKGTAGMSYFRVVIQGDHGVGKTSLARQFSSSDYMGTYDITSSSLDTDLNESTIVPVLLDGEESIMEFIDQPQAYQMDDINVDAYIVVFAIVDRNSYLVATDLVRQLRVNIGTDRPIVLVGNKTDIVRNRHVYLEEARTLATTYDCKYLETSAALNHHVDGLVAGTLSLIRQQLLPPGQKNLLPPPTHKTRSRTPSPVSFFNKLFRRNSRASSSCEGIFMQ